MFFYLDIENGILEPEFNNDIYSYYVSIGAMVEELEFHFKIDTASKINIVGNRNLQVGDNYVFIELDTNNIVKTYTFLVHKEEDEAVFLYEEPIKLEIQPVQKEYPYLVPTIIICCFWIIIILFRLFFFHKNKKRLKNN